MLDLRTIQKWYPWVLSGLAVLLIVVSIPKLVQWNSDENYTIIEYVDGTYAVFDTAGYKYQGFGEVFVYPRYVDAYFSKAADEGNKEDTSIRVTFNDGGWAFQSNHLRFILPVTEEKRIALHRHFGVGEEKDVTAAIGHHLMNCLKNSGPLMSASEHQAQKKSEFYQAVDEQLRKGLYVMERVKQTVDRGAEHSLTDDTETVYVTKIKRDKDGNPLIAAPSPLMEYGIDVGQYSQTGAVYDDETNQQISAKRESYQLGEQAKAGVLNEQQKLIEVIEKGKLAVAEVVAVGNKAKKKVTVEAQQAQDVAGIAQQEAVTKAEEAVGVAGEQLKKAKTDLEISLIGIEQATAEAAELIAKSEATRAKIDQGGALSERDQVMAEQKMRRNTSLAKFISQIPSPRILILGSQGANGQAGNGESNTQATLMNLLMLDKLDKPAKAEK